VLVQWLDLPDTFYWIDPATEGSFNTLAVAVDAKSGLYMQSAVHANPESNLLRFGSAEEVAKSIIGTLVELPNGGVRIPVRREALCQYPRLVWNPSRSTRSPFYPLWEVSTGLEDFGWISPERCGGNLLRRGRDRCVKLNHRFWLQRTAKAE
jgi:hypothetical protein